MAAVYWRCNGSPTWRAFRIGTGPHTTLAHVARIARRDLPNGTLEIIEGDPSAPTARIVLAESDREDTPDVYDSARRRMRSAWTR